MDIYYQYFCVGLFLAMIFTQLGSYRYASSQKDKVRLYKGNSIEGATFGLLGLLMAFTFAGAQGRFEARRQLVVEEVNAIGTAYLRLDTLPSEARGNIQNLFLEYVDHRLNFFPKLINEKEVLAELSETEMTQREIWRLALESSKKNDSFVQSLILLPALNQMFDVVTKRTLSAQAHTSPWVFFIFAYISLICSVFAGFRMARHGVFNWNYCIIFAFAVTVTLFMIFDIEFPRRGFIRLDFAQQALVDLKANMVEHRQAMTLK